MTKKPYHFLVEILNSDNTTTVQRATIVDELNRPMDNLLIDNMKARLYKLYAERRLNVFNVTFVY